MAITVLYRSFSFLSWLIGFTEGDGCFSVNHRKELHRHAVPGSALPADTSHGCFALWAAEREVIEVVSVCQS
jgi:hypothetical protein